MPLLLSVLQNADGREYQKLRIKAMECAGLIAIAVGKEVFRPDSNALIEQLIRIQSGYRCSLSVPPTFSLPLSVLCTFVGVRAM